LGPRYPGAGEVVKKKEKEKEPTKQKPVQSYRPTSADNIYGQDKAATQDGHVRVSASLYSQFCGHSFCSPTILCHSTLWDILLFHKASLEDWMGWYGMVWYGIGSGQCGPGSYDILGVLAVCLLNAIHKRQAAGGLKNKQTKKILHCPLTTFDCRSFVYTLS